MRVLGLISGASHDGIDYASVNFTLRGEVLEAVIDHVGSVPYSADLRALLIAALPPAQVDLQTVTELDTRIGQEFAAAAQSAVDAAPVDLICSHGQTVSHRVREGRAEGTLQLGQPAWIAERTGLPVFSDLRSRDIANGGQGAPLVPILDTMLMAEEPGTQVVRSEHCGVPSEAKEAVACALIGWLGWHGLPGTVASATGADQAWILGTLSPGDSPLRLPEPLSATPRSLRLRSRDTKTAQVEVRPAVTADQAGIVEVFLDCWSISYRGVLPARLMEKMDRERAESLWTKSLSDSSTDTLVAVDQGSVAGVVRFSMKDHGRGHVGALYVSPQSQGAGLGGTLLEAAVATLAERGAQAVTLWVFEDNHPSLTFYRKHGWTPDGERLTDPSFGEPQIRLTRRLT